MSTLPETTASHPGEARRLLHQRLVALALVILVISVLVAL